MFESVDCMALGQVDSPALVELITDAARAEAAAAAARLAAIAELLDRNNAVHDPLDAFDGFAATRTEVGAALGITSRRAGTQLHMAKALRHRLPKIAALLRAGAISERIASIICWRTYLVASEAAAAIDTALAAVAETSGVTGAGLGRLSDTALNQAIDSAIAMHDPDAVPTVHHAARRRDVRFGKPDDDTGTTSIFGGLLSCDAVLVRAALDELIATVCPEDPRTRGELRADAMAVLATRGDQLPCRCNRPDCPQNTDDGAQASRAGAAVIHVIADQAALEAAVHEAATQPSIGTPWVKTHSQTPTWIFTPQAEWTDTYTPDQMADLITHASPHPSKPTNTGADTDAGTATDAATEPDDTTGETHATTGVADANTDTSGATAAGTGPTADTEPDAAGPSTNPAASGKARTSRVAPAQCRPIPHQPEPDFEPDVEPEPDTAPCPEPDADTAAEPEPDTDSCPEPGAAAESARDGRSPLCPTHTKGPRTRRKPPPLPKPGGKAFLLGGSFLPGPLLAELIRTGATITPLKPPGTDSEPRYRPSSALAWFTRARDMTCSFPGCTEPAQQCDIDHRIPWPQGPTHPGNTGALCRTHHLAKTFAGWTVTQASDGTLTWTSPHHATYTQPPGAKLALPDWNTDTPLPPATPPASNTTTTHRDRAMPRRRRTRQADQTSRINTERNINHAANQAYDAEMEETFGPPPKPAEPAPPPEPPSPDDEPPF